MTGCDKPYSKEADEHRRIIDHPYGESQNDYYDHASGNLSSYKQEANDQVLRFRIFGLACNHTMDRITLCRQMCNLVCFFDHVFSKIFGEKWWCSCAIVK